MLEDWKPAAFRGLLFVFSVSWLLQPLVEPDFGWHLRTGFDLLLHHGRLPDTDPYSHSMPDWPWVEHAWLLDGLLALLYRGGGPAGPFAVMLCFALTAGGGILLATYSPRAGWTARLATLALTVWVLLPFLGARTQMVSLLGLACLLWVWDGYCRGRNKSLWSVPCLFLLWANLHGAFTAGLFVLGLFLAGSCLLRLAEDGCAARAGAGWLAGRDESTLRWSQIRHLGLVLALSAAVTLINPYGWRMHHEIFESLGDRFMIETLREWQPVWIDSRAGRWYLAYLAVLAVGLAFLYRRREPLRWTILAVFLVFSLRHLRNIPLFMLVSASLCAELIEEGGLRVTRVLAKHRFGIKFGASAAMLAMAVFLWLLGPDHLIAVVRCGMEPEQYFRQTDYPMEAIEWVRDHPNEVGARMYNEYGVGGFLLWWLPGTKIFIDGRMPAWRVGDRLVLQDYLAMTVEDPPKLEALAKYRIDWALVSVGMPLAQALENKPGWRMVYRDAKSVIFTRVTDEDGPARTLRPEHPA